MANVALDMASQNYKYFETNPANPLQGNSGVDQHMLELTQLPDPSLQASPFWRALPHILGFIFVYLFGGMYFNDDIFYFFPIMFFFPILILIFVCLPKQYVFESSNIPTFINNLSWGFWFGGLSSYILLTIININIPFIIAPGGEANNVHFGTHHFWQAQIVFTALVLTSLAEEIIKCYLCHRSFQRFHGIGASTSSINTLLLNCALNAAGCAIAKGFLALCLIAPNDKIIEYETGLVFDYKYALLHYIPKAFDSNGELYPAIMTIIYALVILPFHTMLGGLWGIGFIRVKVLEHTVAFSQILMFPWCFHFILNLVIAEFFYNVIDNNYNHQPSVYGVTIGVPIFITFVALIVWIMLFKRQIDRSISHLHASALN